MAQYEDFIKEGTEDNDSFTLEELTWFEAVTKTMLLKV